MGDFSSSRPPMPKGAHIPKSHRPQGVQVWDRPDGFKVRLGRLPEREWRAVLDALRSAGGRYDGMTKTWTVPRSTFHAVVAPLLGSVDS
jgi:hypothetical protein